MDKGYEPVKENEMSHRIEASGFKDRPLCGGGSYICKKVKKKK